MTDSPDVIVLDDEEDETPPVRQTRGKVARANQQVPVIPQHQQQQRLLQQQMLQQQLLNAQILGQASPVVVSTKLIQHIFLFILMVYAKENVTPLLILSL